MHTVLNHNLKSPPGTTLREHVLLASGSSDFDLSLASSKRLILHYEKHYSPHETLKGFRGDYYWKDAALHFYLKSPELWEFGLLASNFCPGVPLVYFSYCEGRKTSPRFFIGGADKRIEAVPEPLRTDFLRMATSEKGIIQRFASLADLFA